MVLSCAVLLPAQLPRMLPANKSAATPAAVAAPPAPTATAAAAAVPAAAILNYYS